MRGDKQLQHVSRRVLTSKGCALLGAAVGSLDGEMHHLSPEVYACQVECTAVCSAAVCCAIRGQDERESLLSSLQADRLFRSVDC